MTCPICKQPKWLNYPYCEYCAQQVPQSILHLAEGLHKANIVFHHTRQATGVIEEILGFEFNQSNWVLFPKLWERLKSLDMLPLAEYMIHIYTGFGEDIQPMIYLDWKAKYVTLANRMRVPIWNLNKTWRIMDRADKATNEWIWL